MKHLGAVCLTVALLGAAGLPSAAAQNRATPATPAEREEAAREREALRKRLDALRKDIASREGEREEAADALQGSEEAISQATRRLAEINASQKQAQDELKQLEQRINSEQSQLNTRQQELAALLKRQYATGALTPWSALLSGDDPHDLGRNLTYLGYISQARAAAVSTVRSEIDALNALHGQAAARRSELERLAGEEKAERDELQQQSRERKRVLDNIASTIQTQRQEADSLARDEARMGNLINELTRMLARQAEEARRAEQARREAAERAAQVAREREAAQKAAAARAAAARAAAERTEAERAARNDPPAPGTEAPGAQPPRAEARPDPVEPPPARPATPVARNEAVPDASTAGRFESLRGKLRLPVRGDITGRFGTARGEGGVWRGVFVRTEEGAQVRAVAPGEVVFANWLRGFGNLIIVDHGDGYLSVYGNNQTLLKQVGDSIKAGDVVAGAGATGGQPESGLYFELRHRGKPMDPLQWVSLR